MADVGIYHTFTSTKPDSPDSTLVSSSEWNSPLELRGGSSGQKIIRDSTKPTGMRYSDGFKKAETTQTILGSTPSPINIFAPISMATASPGIITITYTITELTSTAPYSTFILLVNNQSQGVWHVLNGITATTPTENTTVIHYPVQLSTPAARTVHLLCSTSNGSNFLTLSVKGTIIFIGT